MSSDRVFQSLGPATANERSPTVTSRDRGMTSSEEVDDRRRRRDVMSETRLYTTDVYKITTAEALRYGTFFSQGISQFYLHTHTFIRNCMFYGQTTVIVIPIADERVLA